jgi:glycosyltransferase involved in cell wall biosynthesis
VARIVWFHPRRLLPPRGGGELRARGLVEGALAAGHQVLLVHPDDGPTHSEPLPPGLEIALLHARTGVARAATKLLSRDPLRAPRVTTRSLARAERAISDFGPDLAIVSQVMSWSIARRLLPDVPWVYDAHNVERDLFRAHLSLASSPLDRLTFRTDLRRVAAAERQLLGRSDAVLAVSPSDAAGLSRITKLSTTPVIVPSSVTAPSEIVQPSRAPATVLFVGTLNFPPNIAAVHTLVREVMPAVQRQVSDARLLVAGRLPSADLRRLLGSETWIELVEDAPDLADVYRRARCTALPFGAGAGTKLKLFEALAFGLPVVATPPAVAGVEITAGTEVLLGETHADVVARVVEILRDPELADRVGAAGRRAFDERLCWEKAAFPALEKVLSDLAAGAGPVTAPDRA